MLASVASTARVGVDGASRFALQPTAASKETKNRAAFLAIIGLLEYAAPAPGTPSLLGALTGYIG